MEGFDLEAARLIRLEQDVDAWFQVCDPEARQKILGWFTALTRLGRDPMAELRGMDRILSGNELHVPDLSPNQSSAHADDELEMEPLPAARRATLWPYRPRRLPDELLSSWLWRIARGLGAPPRRFVLEAIGVQLADVDRDIDDGAIARLAFLSGQSREHLLRGTMRVDAGADPGDMRGRVQQMLLRHGDLVLNRHRGGRGRAVSITQYCPVCLAGEDTAYLRRGWRFSLEIACSDDGCFLMDSCWKCGALLDPLSHTVPSDEFLCCKCKVQLAEAPSLRISEMMRDQAMLYARLDSLVAQGLPDTIGFSAEDFIDALSASDLRGTNPTNAADRHNVVMMEAWRLLQPSVGQSPRRSRAAARIPRWP